MTTHDPISRFRTGRSWRAAVALIALTALTAASACNDESFRSGPAGPSPAPPASPTATPGNVTLYTPPIDGIVREVGGGPVPGQTVTLHRVARDSGSSRIEATTDGMGRFQFDQLESGPNQFSYIATYKNGYVHSWIALPEGPQTTHPLSLVVRLQPLLQVDEGEPLHTTLSNDDTDYGWPDGPSWNLPVARGPVKVVGITTTSRGPHILRAEWSSADRLSLWAEVYYKEVHVEGSGNGSAVVEVPADWTQDRLNPVTVSVGLPRTARDSGGLPGSINLTLTLTPKYPAP